MSETTTPTWTLGDRIRKARETAGYASQAELATAAGISRATVSNAENGRHTPHPLALRAIADACSVPLSWLVGGGHVALSQFMRSAIHRSTSARRNLRCLPKRTPIGPWPLDLHA